MPIAPLPRSTLDALPDDSQAALDDDPDRALIVRDRQAQEAHLDAQLGAVLVVEVVDSPLGARMLPLSESAMQAWMVNADGERVTEDPEEALNLVVSIAMNDVNGHNDAVTTPDGRTVRLLTENVATPELAETMIDRCWSTVIGDLNNPRLCPPLPLVADPSLDTLDPNSPAYWTAVDRARVRLAAVMLERHAMQEAFAAPDDDPVPAASSPVERRRL